MVGARARESTPAPPGCNITHGSPWPRSSYHIATVGSSTVGMSAPGARDERADMQRGGEGLDLAGAGVDLDARQQPRPPGGQHLAPRLFGELAAEEFGPVADPVAVAEGLR